MKRRSIIFAVAAVALTGALAVMASGVAAGAANRPAGMSAISVSLSVKGQSGATAHESVGQKATLAAQASKLPSGDHVVIAGKQAGSSKWFKVASCGSARCTGSHAEKKPVSDSFEAIILHGTSLTGASVAHSKLVKVIWQSKTALPALSIADAPTPAGNAGGTLTFTVTLSKASAAGVSVSYTTADGNAKAGNDYTATSGTLSIPAGQTSGTIDVTITPDKAPDASSESPETFTVSLSGPVGAKLGRSSATGTITNDDPPAVKSGTYNGSTSQGKALSFDVSADGTSVSNINTTIDLNCTEVPGFTVTLPLQSSGTFPINSDLTFDANEHDVASDGTTLDITFHGQLTASSGGSGTLRVDVSNIPGVPGICSTGDTTWTAS